MDKFIKVGIDEALNAMPESIHRHVEFARRQLEQNIHTAYKFKDLYIIFEAWGDTLMVQCVEGKGLNSEFTKALFDCAINNGFEYIQFVTPHKGLHRMVSELKPERIEYKYICKLSEVDL